MKFFCHTITFLIASPSNDRYLAREMKTHAYWRSASGRLCGKTRKNLQNTRHTATCIDWSRGVSSLLHEDQMTAYYSPLTPRYVGKEYGNTTWNRSRAAWIIIHFVLQATSTCCVGAVHLQAAHAGVRESTRAPQRRRAGGRRAFISPESVYMTGIW